MVPHWKVNSGSTAFEQFPWQKIFNYHKNVAALGTAGGGGGCGDKDLTRVWRWMVDVPSSRSILSPSATMQITLAKTWLSAALVTVSEITRFTRSCSSFPSVQAAPICVSSAAVRQLQGGATQQRVKTGHGATTTTTTTRTR